MSKLFEIQLKKKIKKMAPEVGGPCGLGGFPQPHLFGAGDNAAGAGRNGSSHRAGGDDVLPAAVVSIHGKLEHQPCLMIFLSEMVMFDVQVFINFPYLIAR